MNPWKWLWGSSEFGWSSTAEQVTQGVDASHLTAIVTGATSGIGKETARILALRGARVIVPALTLESGIDVKEGILKQNPDAKIQVMEMDLSSLESVKSFARSFNSTNKHLNILINNAGIMGYPFQLSRDGIELHFATNHLGHHLLTDLLLNKMRSTAKETGIQGRIVNVSSLGHRGSDAFWFDLDKLNDKTMYNSFRAYNRSKLASILHANELSRLLKEEGSNITANSLHPGAIKTEIYTHLNINAVLISVLTPLAKAFIKSIEQGAATTCYVALNPKVKDVTGKYFADCNQATPSSQARDEILGQTLWEFSKELIRRSGHGE